MKYVTLKQTKVITASTGPEFQDKLNSALAEVALSGCKYDLQFNNNFGLCAFLVYEERKEIAETVADQYELRGEDYRCSECSYFRPSPDKRVKYTTCAQGERRRYANAHACDWFYEELERGGDVLVEEECIETPDPV